MEVTTGTAVGRERAAAWWGSAVSLGLLVCGGRLALAWFVDRQRGPVVWWLAVVRLGVLLPGWALVRCRAGGASSPTDLGWAGPPGLVVTLVTWLAGAPRRARPPDAGRRAPWSRCSCSSPASPRRRTVGRRSGRSSVARSAPGRPSTPIGARDRAVDVGGRAGGRAGADGGLPDLPPGPALPDGAHRRAAAQPRSRAIRWSTASRSATTGSTTPSRPSWAAPARRPRRRDPAAALDARRAAGPAGQPRSGQQVTGHWTGGVGAAAGVALVRPWRRGHVGQGPLTPARHLLAAEPDGDPGVGPRASRSTGCLVAVLRRSALTTRAAGLCCPFFAIGAAGRQVGPAARHRCAGSDCRARRAAAPWRRSGRAGGAWAASAARYAVSLGMLIVITLLAVRFIYPGPTA